VGSKGILRPPFPWKFEASKNGEGHIPRSAAVFAAVPVTFDRAMLSDSHGVTRDVQCRPRVHIDDLLQSCVRPDIQFPKIAKREPRLALCE